MSYYKKNIQNKLKQISKQDHISKSDNILFIQTDKRLDSIYTFSQYVFAKKRLITLVGELHGHPFSCGSNNLDIGEYCFERVKANPTIKILLEYNSGMAKPELINSEAIRSVYSMLKKQNKLNVIVPFDFRASFIKPEGQQILYTNDFLNKYNPQYCIDFFIEPFFSCSREGYFNLNQQLYDKKYFKFLYDVYLKSIESEFRRIASLNINPKPKAGEIQKALKHAWMSVSDFYILAEIWKLDNSDECIVISGNNHTNNIIEIFERNNILQLNYQSGNPGKCVDLYETYILS